MPSQRLPSKPVPVPPSSKHEGVEYGSSFVPFKARRRITTSGNIHYIINNKEFAKDGFTNPDYFPFPPPTSGDSAAAQPAYLPKTSGRSAHTYTSMPTIPASPPDWLGSAWEGKPPTAGRDKEHKAAAKRFSAAFDEFLISIKG